MMHPEIKKFFLKAHGEPIYLEYNTYFQNVDGVRYIMARRWEDGGELFYPFYDGWHTEQEMLRLIKLKAFL